MKIWPPHRLYGPSKPPPGRVETRGGKKLNREPPPLPRIPFSLHRRISFAYLVCSPSRRRKWCQWITLAILIAGTALGLSILIAYLVIAHQTPTHYAFVAIASGRDEAQPQQGGSTPSPPAPAIEPNTAVPDSLLKSSSSSSSSSSPSSADDSGPILRSAPPLPTWNLDGRPFQFVGANANDLASLTMINPPLHATRSGLTGRELVRDMVKGAAEARLNVLRLWATDVEGEPPQQISPGVYDPDLLDGLDFSIYMAQEFGMRVILCLVDNWSLDRQIDWADEAAGRIVVVSQYKIRFGGGGVVTRVRVRVRVRVTEILPFLFLLGSPTPPPSPSAPPKTHNGQPHAQWTTMSSPFHVPG